MLKYIQENGERLAFICASTSLALTSFANFRKTKQIDDLKQQVFELEADKMV